METKELVLLLNNLEGQLRLYEKAKSGDGQSMIDFIRLCILKKIWKDCEGSIAEKVAAFEEIMGLVKLTADEGNQNG